MDEDNKGRLGIKKESGGKPKFFFLTSQIQERVYVYFLFYQIFLRIWNFCSCECISSDFGLYIFLGILCYTIVTSHLIIYGFHRRNSN